MITLGPLRIYYGWVIVVVAFLAIVVSSGARAAFPILMVPLEQEFQWDRASIALAASVNLLMFGLVGPLVGKLMDQRGVRAVMLGSLVLVGIGTTAMLFMSAVWHLYLLWGVVLGAGMGGAAGVLSATIAARWFSAKRGLVIGLLTAGYSAGQMIFMPLLMWVILVGAWRDSVLVLSAVLLAVVLPLVFLFMRNDPKDVGVGLDGNPLGQEVGGTAGARDRRENFATPMSQVVRSPDFWLLALAFSVCGGTSGGLIGTHLIPHAIDHNISAMGATAAISIMGVMNFFGTAGAGWLSDRMDKRVLLAAVFGFRALSLFVLPFVSDVNGLAVFAVLYGIDWLATAPPLMGLIAERFGRQSMGTVTGWVFLTHQIGAAAMAWAAGVVRVEAGDYAPAFMAGGFIALIAVGFCLRVSPMKVAIPAATPLRGPGAAG